MQRMAERVVYAFFGGRLSPSEFRAQARAGRCDVKLAVVLDALMQSPETSTPSAAEEPEVTGVDIDCTLALANVLQLEGGQVVLALAEFRAVVRHEAYQQEYAAGRTAAVGHT